MRLAQPFGFLARGGFLAGGGGGGGGGTFLGTGTANSSGTQLVDRSGTGGALVSGGSIDSANEGAARAPQGAWPQGWYLYSEVGAAVLGAGAQAEARPCEALGDGPSGIPTPLAAGCIPGAWSRDHLVQEAKGRCGARD